MNLTVSFCQVSEQLQSIFGPLVMLKLAEQVTAKGRQLSIPTKMPKTKNSNHHLIKLVGYEATKKLVTEFGGMKIYIPKKETLLRQTAKQQRIDKIISGWQDGQTIAILAAENGLSYRQVHRLITNVRRRDNPTKMDDNPRKMDIEIPFHTADSPELIALCLACQVPGGCRPAHPLCGLHKRTLARQASQ